MIVWWICGACFSGVLVVDISCGPDRCDFDGGCWCSQLTWVWGVNGWNPLEINARQWKQIENLKEKQWFQSLGDRKPMENHCCQSPSDRKSNENQRFQSPSNRKPKQNHCFRVPTIKNQRKIKVFRVPAKENLRKLLLSTRISYWMISYCTPGVYS